MFNFSHKHIHIQGGVGRFYLEKEVLSWRFKTIHYLYQFFCFRVLDTWER